MELSRQLRVGLQAKAVVILAFIVLGAMVCAGWFYYQAAWGWLRSEDQRRAERIAQAFSMAAQHDLQGRRYEVIQGLVDGYLRNDNILYIAVVDSTGRIVASASKDDRHGEFAHVAALALSVRVAYRAGNDEFVLANPVVMRRDRWGEDRLIGGIRLVMDTAATTAQLRAVLRKISLVGALIVIFAIPAGYLLVWRAMIQPVGRLLKVTRCLGQGDFQARASMRRNDEIGELAVAFDRMAEDVEGMRDKLVEANESLEQKVIDRTSALEVVNNRLREEMAEKEDFLRAVSHDLNAPLRNIAGMATMVMMKWSKELPEDVIARLQRIQANVDVETELIGELLELSRIRTRRQHRELTDMGALAETLAQTFEFELKNRNIELVVQESMPQIYVEKSRMRQVLQNLIDNAIKYMHRSEGGRINVGYELSDGMHVFKVRDNGPGIPRDQQEKVFYVFRRATNASNSSIDGKGVGLALVKSIVANYDGKAWVESDEGAGACFCVALSTAQTRPTQRPGFRPAEEMIHETEANNTVSR